MDHVARGSRRSINRPAGYTRLQIRLHWIVAAIVALQFLLNEPISRAWDAFVHGATVSFDPLVALHVAGGLLIAGLAVWRLALKARRGPPRPPEGEPRPLVAAANVTHLALYALLLLMPLSGAVAWFGGVEPAAEAHEAFKVALLALVGLHVVAALFHHFVLKTDVMRRMWRPA